MKTKNSLGFTHNVALVVLGVVVATVVAGAGVNVYRQRNSSSASAAGWSTVWDGIWDVKACKIAGISNTYKYYVLNPTKYTISISTFTTPVIVKPHTNSTEYINSTGIVFISDNMTRTGKYTVDLSRTKSTC